MKLDLKEWIDKANNNFLKVNSLIITANATASGSVAANSNSYVTVTAPSKPGYTCIGVVRVSLGSGVNNVAISGFEVGGIRIKNTSSSSVSYSMTVTYLYVAT